MSRVEAVQMELVAFGKIEVHFAVEPVAVSIVGKVGPVGVMVPATRPGAPDIAVHQDAAIGLAAGIDKARGVAGRRHR